MAKHDFLLDLLANLFDDPIAFLKSFIMLVVPSGLLLWILITGTYAENTGHGIIGGLLLFIYKAIDKITLTIFEIFIDLVVYLVVIVIIAKSILAAFGLKK